MNRLRSLYRRIVPASLRDPLGIARRQAWDRMQRAMSREPLPRATLLRNLQSTLSVTEFLEVGRAGAAAVVRELGSAGFSAEAPARVLDFGCGPARVLRHLRGTAWEIHGCDIDPEAIAFASSSFPAIDFRVTRADPPLPWPDDSFDIVLAISLFPHLSRDEHLAWSRELARVLRAGGVMLLSTVGIRTLGAFEGGEEIRAELTSSGFVEKSGTRPSLHAPAGIARLFSPHFDLTRWIEQGLGGFEDLTLLRRR